MQVFYLDNIDFGVLNLPHDIFPRWKQFSTDCLNSMIQADTNLTFGGSSKAGYGRLQVLCALIIIFPLVIKFCFNFTILFAF